MIVFLIISGIISLPLYLSEINVLKSIQSAINKVEDDVTKGKQLQARCSLPTENEKEVWNEMENEFSRSIPPEKKLLSLVKDIAKIAHDCSIYDISFSMPTVQVTTAPFLFRVPILWLALFREQAQHLPLKAVKLG